MTVTLFASINGGPSTAVSSPRALNLPNIGDAAVVTAYEGSRQISLSFPPRCRLSIFSLPPP